jgi:H+/Cl- antiporter ClcA
MQSDMDRADSFSLRRARLATIGGTIFMISLGGSFHENAVSPPDGVQLAAWIVWALVLIAFIAWGAGLLRSRAVRTMVEDEVTRAHRRDALALGFWGAIAGALIVYALSLWQPITVREGLRGVVTLAVALALLRFGGLERRALQD